MAAVNGVGEGHIVNGTATTEEESKPTTSFFFSTSDKKLHSVSVIWEQCLKDGEQKIRYFYKLWNNINLSKAIPKLAYYFLGISFTLL